MKEHPMLFSGPMVRAILEDRKTVTRRAVKSDWIQSERAPLETSPGIYHFWCSGERPCPYGKPGDRLWVRETFRDARTAGAARVLYKATGDVACGWKPSIHMPRDCSRIQLEVTTVRVERLHDISEEQAEAEGVRACESELDPDGNCYSATELFSILWSTINGVDSYNANPWVWVIEFRRVPA